MQNLASFTFVVLFWYLLAALYCLYVTKVQKYHSSKHKYTPLKQIRVMHSKERSRPTLQPTHAVINREECLKESLKEGAEEVVEFDAESRAPESPDWIFT